MRFLERLATLLKTLNPDAYEKLCQEFSVLEAWKQFFFNYATLLVLLLLIFVPAVLLGAGNLQAKLQGFSSFSLDANVSAAAPVTLLTNPDIVVDLRENATTPARILFTKKGIEWKALFSSHARSWEEVRDVKGVSDSALSLFLLFLIPSLAFWSGLLFLLLFLVTVLVASLLVFLVPKLWHFRLAYPTALKLSLFAATSMMATGLLLIPFYRSVWLPLTCYLVFLALGVALVGERKLSHAPKRPRTRQQEIWD